MGEDGQQYLQHSVKVRCFGEQVINLPTWELTSSQTACSWTAPQMSVAAALAARAGKQAICDASRTPSADHDAAGAAAVRARGRQAAAAAGDVGGAGGGAEAGARAVRAGCTAPAAACSAHRHQAGHGPGLVRVSFFAPVLEVIMNYVADVVDSRCWHHQATLHPVAWPSLQAGSGTMLV